jgi:ketosteroid isomerase-like protein
MTHEVSLVCRVREGVVITRTIVFACLVLVGCASAPAPCVEAPGAATGEKRAAEVRKRLDDTFSHVMAAFRRGDLAACLETYAPDAVVWDDTTEHSLRGRAAIETVWKPMMGKVKDATCSVDDFEVSGPLAYTSDHCVVTLDDGSPPAYGKFMQVWKERPDGSWLIIREVGSNKTVK